MMYWYLIPYLFILDSGIDSNEGLEKEAMSGTAGYISIQLMVLNVRA